VSGRLGKPRRMEPSLYVLSECIDWVSAGSEAAFARKPCNFLRLLPAKS
jgi:hypothetical protein